MNELIKEQEDLHAAKKSGVRLVRPPKTVKETIETLREADQRYENAKEHLLGSKGSL